MLDGLKANGEDPRYPASRLMGWEGSSSLRQRKIQAVFSDLLNMHGPTKVKWISVTSKEGETYDMIDGLPKYKDEVNDLMLKDNNAWYAKYGFTASTLLWRAGKVWDDASARDFQKDKPEEFAVSAAVKINFDSYSLGMDNIEPDGSSPEGVINVKVKDLWNKTNTEIGSCEVHSRI